jgi:hypothetical protein
VTNYVARNIADRIDALNGDAPLGAVLELAAAAAPVEVREALGRFHRKARPTQEGDDLTVAHARDDSVMIRKDGAARFAALDPL